MTLHLKVECNLCGNWENIELEQIIDVIKEAENNNNTDKPLSAIIWRCGKCHASEAREAMERIF